MCYSVFIQQEIKYKQIKLLEVFIMSQVRNVIVGGQNIDLGTSMEIEEARQVVQDLGLATNISNAKVNMLNDSTIEFINQYGENGIA